MQVTKNPDGYVIKYILNPGEEIAFHTYGPCLVLLSQGEVSLYIKGSETKLGERSIRLIPHIPFRLEACINAKVHLLLPDLVRLLAESLGMDFTDRTGIKKARIKAVPLFSSRSTTVDFFTGLRPDDLVGTDYAELKMKEISYLAQAETTPSYRQKLLTALTSRDWFFRIRVCDAAARCDTVTEAASIMGLTASGFSKRFKKVFGEPYYHWRQAQRLAEVKYELQNTAVPLKDISAKYGFYSVQHFGHAVKKYTGQPPGRLRGESQGVKNLRDDAGSKE